MRKIILVLSMIILGGLVFTSQSSAMGFVKKRGGSGGSSDYTGPRLNHLFNSSDSEDNNFFSFFNRHHHSNNDSDEEDDNNENQGPYHHEYADNGDPEGSPDQNEEEGKKYSGHRHHKHHKHHKHHLNSLFEDDTQDEGDLEFTNEVAFRESEQENTVNAVPEPMTMTLMGAGLAGMYFKRKKLHTK